MVIPVQFFWRIINLVPRSSLGNQSTVFSIKRSSVLLVMELCTFTCLWGLTWPHKKVYLKIKVSSPMVTAFSASHIITDADMGTLGWRPHLLHFITATRKIGGIWVPFL